LKQFASSGVRDVFTKLYETETALMEWWSTPRQQMITACDQLFTLTLRQWTMLPCGSGIGLPCHESFLGLTQRVVEARDSLLVASSLRNAQGQLTNNQGGTGPSMAQTLQPTIAELKNTLAVWRERLPNKWDPISLWDTVLTWRHHVFSFIMTSLQSMNVDKEIFE
jgi:hypothetical protein